MNKKLVEFKNHPNYPPRKHQPFLLTDNEENYFTSRPAPFYDNQTTERSDTNEKSLYKFMEWLSVVYPKKHVTEFVVKKKCSYPEKDKCEVVYDNGKPLNPHGDYGLNGRGILWGWGPNLAADHLRVVKTQHGTAGLFVKRKDGTIAIPGGFIDNKETVKNAAIREFYEETGGVYNLQELLHEEVKILEEFYPCTLDPRTTNNAWILTFLLVSEGKGEELDYEFKPDLEGDVSEPTWISLENVLKQEMYANHKDLIKSYLRSLI